MSGADLLKPCHHKNTAPIQNGQKCLDCGREIHWDSSLRGTGGGKKKSPKPWREVTYLVQ